MKLTLVFVLAIPLGAAAEWRAATPDYQWNFPRDFWPHPGFRNEWWYFTGQLSAEGGSPRFGYQFTIFRIGLVPARPEGDSRWHAANLLMGHAAVTDLVEGRHLFSEVLYREVPELADFAAFPEPRIAWSLGPPGGEGSWELSWNGDGFDLAMVDPDAGTAFELSTRGARRPLLQGVNGFSRKAAASGAASHYYSLPRLATNGWIETAGRRRPVSGTSWMDHEFSSNVLQEDQVGWDWFSLQMADGGALMLFRLRDASGATDFASGTLAPAGAENVALSANDFVLEPLERWTSPRSRALYPVRWRVTLASGLEFTVEALLEDQENYSGLVAGLSYWEGAVRAVAVDGSEVGRGYLEMTGYGPGTRPPL